MSGLASSCGIAGNKMLAHIDRLRGERKPVTADIFLTNYCNNRCRYCTYSRWDFDSGARAMSFDEFRRYAGRLRELGVEGFILTGGGEPTLCPDFLRITEWLEGERLHYGVNTNFNKPGVFFRPDFLKVSLDGFDEDSYQRWRGVRMYGQVVANIVAFEAWCRMHSPKTRIGVQCVARNVEDVRAFYEANRSLPVAYFSFRPLESTGGECYASAAAQGQARAVRTAIEELAERDGRVYLNYKWDFVGTRPQGCPASWAQIAVNERGEVMFCCHKPTEIVGHVMDEDILEKKRMASTDANLCDVPCRMSGPNRFMLGMEGLHVDSEFL